MLTRRRTLTCILIFAITLIPTAVAFAQNEAKPAPCAPAPSKSAWEIEHERQLHEDWAQFERYRAANAKVAPPAADEQRVVFLGDSITDAWRETLKPEGPDMGAFFKGKPYYNRGISGQTTSQMLVRFRADVIDLKPKAVVILAGTNDLAGNTGEISVEGIAANLATISELAHAHGIRVVLVSVLPVGDYPWRRGRQPAPKIAALNKWLAEYAKANGHIYVDLHTPTANPDGSMRKEFSEDGVHPNHEGYALMERVLQPAVDQALKK